MFGLLNEYSSISFASLRAQIRFTLAEFRDLTSFISHGHVPHAGSISWHFRTTSNVTFGIFSFSFGFRSWQRTTSSFVHFSHIMRLNKQRFEGMLSVLKDLRLLCCPYRCRDRSLCLRASLSTRLSSVEEPTVFVELVSSIEHRRWSPVVYIESSSLVF